MKDSVVKIDTELLDSVEEFINLDKNKFKFVNKKQFVDLAVNEYLARVKKKNKKRGKK